MSTAIRPGLALALVFAVLLAAFESIYGSYFQPDPGIVGSDYSLAFPALLDAYLWFRQNGLAAPWFTPAFCAGQPMFADPQSVYYSLPQFLSFVVSPLAAVHLLLLICAAAMFWGGYLLMRRVFGSSATAAVLVGGLLMFNGFLPHRALVGHIGFHAFALTPWLALLLLAPARSSANGFAAAIAAGALIAYWVHAGFGTLVLAGGLAVLAVALVHALRGGELTHFVARGTLATLVGLGLSASKLAASFAFLSHFGRTYYALPGAPSVADAMAMIAGALLLPSQLAHDFGVPRLVNLQWALDPHEWAFDFGFVIIPLAASLGIGRLRTLRWKMPTLRQAALWTALLLSLLWPVAFNFWSPDWNAFLKAVPLINSTSTPLRWLIVYIPIAAVGLGLLMDRGASGRAANLIVASCLIATVAQSAWEPRDYYRAQRYDARPVLIADGLVRADELSPSITALGTEVRWSRDKDVLALKRNDTFIAGVSQVFCYNPIFGYRLEKFSAANLRAGPVLAEHDGFLNLKNPACYVFPEENGCRPGDLFRADQAAQAAAFVAYRPFAFEIPLRQKIANAVTLLTGLLVAGTALAWLLHALRRHAPAAPAADAGAPSRSISIVGAALSVAWLIVCVGIAWLMVVPLDLPGRAFGAVATAEGIPLAKPRELIETVSFFVFIATWFPLALGFVAFGDRSPLLRRLAQFARAPRISTLAAVLPWVFLAALYLWAEEATPYMAASLKFSEWAFFQNFAANALFYGFASALLLLVVGASARACMPWRRFANAFAFVAFCILVLFVAWNVAFVAPSDGYVLNWDTHHKSAVLSPVVDFMLTGTTAKSQYGGYYVWAGAFAKLAAAAGLSPLVAVDAFFFLALIVSFTAYGLAARIATGSWSVALLALGAAIAFAGIRFRGFSYLQVEPIRWLFPALCLAAYAIVLRRCTPSRAQSAALFALVPFALQWNPETGLVCGGALFFSLAATRPLRRLAEETVLGLVAGGVALFALVRIAAWYCAAPAAGTVAATAPGSAGSLLAFAFLDVVRAEMPLLHVWQLLWLLACIFFVAASRELRESATSQTAAGTIQLGAAMALFMFFYYQGLSVPGTLRALSFTTLLAAAVLAYRALVSLPARATSAMALLREASAGQLSAAAMLVPLACLAVLAPLNGGTLGRTFDPSDMEGISRESQVAKGVCGLAESLANGKEVLYISEDSWWYQLACGQPLDRGLVSPSLILSDAEWTVWVARAQSAGAIVFEDALLSPGGTNHYAKMRVRMKAITDIVEARGLHPIRIPGRNGNSLMVYGEADPRSVALRN